MSKAETLEACLRRNSHLDSKETNIRKQLAFILNDRGYLQNDIVEVVDKLLDLQSLFPYMPNLVHELKDEGYLTNGNVMVTLSITGLQIDMINGPYKRWRLQEIEGDLSGIVSLANEVEKLHNLKGNERV